MYIFLCACVQRLDKLGQINNSSTEHMCIAGERGSVLVRGGIREVIADPQPTTAASWLLWLRLELVHAHWVTSCSSQGAVPVM